MVEQLEARQNGLLDNKPPNWEFLVETLQSGIDQLRAVQNIDELRTIIYPGNYPGHEKDWMTHLEQLVNEA